MNKSDKKNSSSKDSQETKKPDSVVYDEASETYNAALLPYATSVGAPVIVPDDLNHWKNKGINRVNHHLHTKFAQLKSEYEAMQELFEWNDLIYSTKFNFEPIIGEIYHLYEGKDGKPFLSLINPESWSRVLIGSFQLNTEQMWIKQDPENKDVAE